MNIETVSYNDNVMGGRPPTKEAPFFGQRLGALRRSRGLTQTVLAQKLQITQKMIDYYERRAVNPSLDFIQRAAEALDVSVADLLGSVPKTIRRRPGPPPQIHQRLELLNHLPRKDQKFVIQFLDAYLEKIAR